MVDPSEKTKDEGRAYAWRVLTDTCCEESAHGGTGRNGEERCNRSCRSERPHIAPPDRPMNRSGRSNHRVHPVGADGHHS